MLLICIMFHRHKPPVKLNRQNIDGREVQKIIYVNDSVAFRLPVFYNPSPPTIRQG